MEEAVLHQTLSGALRLPGARLAVYQPKLLVSFATETLADGPERVEQDGHVAWRVGARDGHNLYLSPTAVREVAFTAEPWDCLEGRVNLAVWFLADHATGNPARMDGYFCVSLEDPYDEAGKPRADRFAAVFELFQRLHGQPGVCASDAFLRELEHFAVRAA